VDENVKLEKEISDAEEFRGRQGLGVTLREATGVGGMLTGVGWEVEGAEWLGVQKPPVAKVDSSLMVNKPW
jgi:hypothetical protein